MQQLTGNEEFILHNTGTGVHVNDFWRWAIPIFLIIHTAG